MINSIDKIQSILFEQQDLKYREFNTKLIPTVNENTMIGVRTPVLRKIAKDVSKSPEVSEFLKSLPHTYYEENNIHGFVISSMNDFNKVILELDAFLPYVDNWATCDLISPKCFKKHHEELIPHIKRWLSSNSTYTVRFGIDMLMSFYLDETFSPEYLELVASIKSSEYYINMMIAWYFATALAKQYNSAIVFIEQNRLDNWTHNKTIQKAIESYRITSEQKEYLKGLRRKK